MVNLLTNAVKYSRDEGRIWLKATDEGDEAVVRVEGEGVGIDAEMLPRIFDMSTQEELSRLRSECGLGLGLPLVEEMMTLHGDTVQIHSEGGGKGIERTVRLPLQQGARPA